MARRTQLNLPAGKILAVTASSHSSGNVRRLAPSGDTTTIYAPAAVAASQTLSLGPFLNDRAYEIITDIGLALTSVVTASDLTIATTDELGVGDVVGPGSATDAHLAVFDGTTGKLLKDGGAPGGGGSFLSANTARVDPSGNDGTGTVGDLAKPFLTVQGAINAIQALDPIPDWPVIDVGTMYNIGESVTTSLLTLVIQGNSLENYGIPIANNGVAAFDQLTFTEPTQQVSFVLKDCSASTVIKSTTGVFNLFQFSSYLDELEILGGGPVYLYGNGSSWCDGLYDPGGSTVEIHDYFRFGAFGGHAGSTYSFFGCPAVSVPTAGTVNLINSTLLNASNGAVGNAPAVINPKNLLFFNPTTTTEAVGVFSNDGVPDGNTGYALAGKASIALDTANGQAYINTGGNNIDGTPQDWRLLLQVAAANRVTAQNAANASIATFTVGGADGSFEVSMNMNVTAATVISTALKCDYTDENNVARSMIFPVTGLTGSFLAGGLVTATGAFETPAMHIRCKAGTAITLYTAAGTFTGATYSAEGIIKQTQ
jgi:hypothetical protein